MREESEGDRQDMRKCHLEGVSDRDAKIRKRGRSTPGRGNAAGRACSRGGILKGGPRELGIVWYQQLPAFTRWRILEWLWGGRRRLWRS